MADLLTTTQAAVRLGVSRMRVVQLIGEGKLPAQKLGRDWMIRPKDLGKVTVYGKPGRPSGNEMHAGCTREIEKASADES